MTMMNSPKMDCVGEDISDGIRSFRNYVLAETSSNNKTLNARLLAQVCHRSYIIAASRNQTYPLINYRNNSATLKGIIT
jgi:hypothetical protein